jgi:hypothetical protein
MIPIENLATNLFLPNHDDPNTLPHAKGLYLITVNDLHNLPEPMRGLQYHYLLNRPIIYVGISNHSLRTRDYKIHFNGNARRSTLRKSLGSLMHLEPAKKDSNKYKFIISAEVYLSEWMKNHLFLHYHVTDQPGEIEKQLIAELNPPLNIKDNHNAINLEFRKRLIEERANRL